MRELVWVGTPEALKESVREAKQAGMVALDAEMDSYFCYHTKLCLLQMSAGEKDYLIDPLVVSDLTPMNEFTQDPEIRKVFHAGENDVPYFRRRGVEFKNIFDTHVAAKLLNLPSRSLGGLVEHYFDVTLPKDHSRADWRVRPLPEEQVDYARQDTQYLCRLAELMAKELEEAEAEREAGHIFRSLEGVSLRPKTFDPEGWARIKGARELSGVQRAVLHELYAWREREAEKADLAVFRVAHNGALLSLARKRFRSPDQLRGWAKSSTFRENAEEIMEAMERGRERGAVPFPDTSKRRAADWSPENEKLFHKLRKWRNEESERQGIEPSRVFSNRQLKSVAREKPTDAVSLAQVDGLEPWKLEQYGESVLQLLAAPDK